MTAPGVSSTIPFIDLRAQYRSIQSELDAAIARVLDSGMFVLGPSVSAFERAFADYIGAKECVCVNSGTAALQLALTVAGIGAGDEVIIPANTFFATAEAVLWAGARPVLVDVRADDSNIDPKAIARAITPRTKAIVPVHLYGQPARMDEILAIAGERRIAVVEDACQAHGAAYRGRRAGSLGVTSAFSFYPGKNLGAFGEGGAIVTDDPAMAERCRGLRDHGQVRKYEHAELGHNFRLEAIQGAVLGVKLPYLERWNDARRRVAAWYREDLAGLPLGLPVEREDARHVYHLFVVRTPRRDALREHLRAAGIETLIHYPIPLHRQRALSGLSADHQPLPVTEALAGEILSLPLYPEMEREQTRRVADATRSFFASGERA